MNERIKQLAEQAGVTGYFAAGTKLATPIPLSPEMQKFAELILGTPIPLSPEMQKFAELIVRECMEVASPNYMRTPEDSVYYVEQAIDRIAEHFGVEE